MRARLLQVVLIVVGVLFCLSAPMLILPASYWKTVASWFIGSEIVDALWPMEPVFDYALRTSMVAYLWIGAVLLLAATDPDRYRSQVDIAIGGLVLLAVICLAAGLLNAIPAWWFLGDSIPCLVGAILLFLLRPRRRA